jgi:uncharacterized protein YndB with AHSA1/START domain
MMTLPTDNDAYATMTEGILRLERIMPGPIERLWEYLTDPEKRSLWLAGGPMDLQIGGRVRLEFDHSQLSAETVVPEQHAGCEAEPCLGRITACEPPRLLSYTWAEDAGVNSEVTFELEPQGDAVRLVLTHRRLEGRELLIGVCAGWHAHLAILLDRLKEREPRGFWTTHTRLEAEYAERL